MRLARVLGVIGRGLISAGVIVLLFVGYQLWGTGLQHSQAQGSLENQLEDLIGAQAPTTAEDLAQAAEESRRAIAAGQILASNVELEIEPDGESGEELVGDGDESADAADEDQASPTGASVVEGNFNEAERQAILAKLYPDPGDALARIVIPAIGVDQIVVEGVSVEDLRKGPGHYQSTPNPGQAGNASIAGHRTTYGAPFHRVDELIPGDSIFVTTAQGTFQYRVMPFEDEEGNPTRGYFIVDPSQTEVLNTIPDKNTLTLTACHPKYSARQRIIVQAELVGEPAPTIPRDEAVDLEPMTLDSGAVDERAASASAIPAEEQVVIGDDVAADDDPSVDADGNPTDIGDTNTDQANASDTGADDTNTDQPNASDTGADDTNTDQPNASDTGADDTNASEANADETQAGEAVTLASRDDESAAATTIGDESSIETPGRVDGEEDFGEGLNGDRTKIKPAILWGIAALSIWTTAWFMGVRLNRKWTMYAVGVLPFFVVLWSSFVNIDQALPSY